MTAVRQSTLSKPDIPDVEKTKVGIIDNDRDFLYEEEVNELIKRARNQGRNPLRDACAILMCYRHGLRVSELVNLQWSNIDWRSNRIFISRAKGSNDGYHPLYPDELKMLRALRKKNREREEEREIGIPWIFASSHDTRMSTSNFRKLIYTLSEGMAVKVHPHSFRHGCGFYLINKGHDVRVVQEYLGHSSIANTVRYTKLSSKKFEGLWG